MIAKAAEGGKAEVDLAGLALQKAASGDIAEFERVAAGARDADVKAFASNTLLPLEEHVRQAEAARRQNLDGHGAWTPAHQRHTTGRSAGRIQGFFGPH